MSNTRKQSGRVIEYTNQTPFETDFLYSNMYNMVNASYLASAILASGNNNATLVAGLPCTQNSSPNLSVLIGAGVMFNYQQFDATAYGVIGADTASTDNLYKPYIQTTQYNTSTSLPTVCGGGTIVFTPPGSGTTNYLLQATLLTVDTDSLSRPYFNPANPAAPIFNTAPQTRWDTIFYSLKSAVSPSIPTPDAGYVGLYVIAVASGATQILNGDISVYSGAPFITESLTQKVSYNSLQKSSPLYATDSGTANAYSVIPSPAYTSYVAGTIFYLIPNNSNTGASTININGLGAKNIYKQTNTSPGAVALTGGELVKSQLYILLFDGTQFQVLNPSYPASIGASGYQYLPNGLILQWGSATIPASGSTIANLSINFPLAFPNNLYSVTTSYNNKPNPSWQELTHGAFSLTTSSFSFNIGTADPSTNITQDVAVTWMAIGN